MKILHCCLSCFYIDGYGYQENIIPRINFYDGNDVLIIASRETYIDGELKLTDSRKYITEYGVPIIRLQYVNIGSEKLERKLRIFKGFKEELERYSPDVVLFHGTCSYELITLKKYILKHPNVRVFIDSHEDYHNSARTKLSRNTLYRFWYKPIIRTTYQSFKKILYVTDETRKFLISMFGLPENALEFYPLGGIIPNEEDYRNQREMIRNLLQCSDDTVLCIHCGKLTQRKKTKLLLEGFFNSTNKNIRLIIIGRADEETKKNIDVACLRDSRIQFLGWKTEEDLGKYLSAADLYIQPGTQSATMQNALCHKCAVMLYPYKSHKLFVDNNGYYVSNAVDIECLLNKVNSSIIDQMSCNSLRIARQYLDYYKLSRRLFENN